MVPFNQNLLVVVGGLAAAFAILSRRSAAAASASQLEAAREVRDLAESTVDAFGFNVDPQMMVRIAFIESSFNDTAIRFEPHIADASAGLMQTLTSTARWLATDMGYSAFGVPTLDQLFQSQVSLYFGAAYLDYLSRYRGKRRSEEWIVKSYNGGPGATNDQVRDYFRKYQAAKERFG